jgi:hypothetical protein
MPRINANQDSQATDSAEAGRQERPGTSATETFRRTSAALHSLCGELAEVAAIAPERAVRALLEAIEELKTAQCICLEALPATICH